MARLVLSHTSPLIGLSRVEGLSWPAELFGRVFVTLEVARELRGGSSLESEIENAFKAGWISVYEAAEAETEPSGIPKAPPPHLGRGEWSSLRAAASFKGQVLLLLDDRLARREARALGIEFIGTAAIITMAARRGLIPSARDIFEALLQSDFRLSPAVIRAALRESGAS